jgi:nicotinate dehydrogenase subunit B
VHWTAEALYVYLRMGQESRHGTAAGPMVEVTHNLAGVSEADVRAIAAYVADQMPQTDVAPPPRGERAAASEEGSRIFAGACAVCHAAVPPPFSGAAVPLGLTTSLNAPDARNAIHVIMEGLHPEGGDKGAWMPEFATELTDTQIAALVDYLRMRFTDGPAWPDVPRQISMIRQALKEEP